MAGIFRYHPSYHKYLHMKQDIRYLVQAKNIGPAVAKKLNSIGIYTLPDLAVRTPAKAYRELIAKFPGTTLPVSSYLFALQGALMNVDWHRLPKRLQKELLDKVNKHSE